MTGVPSQLDVQELLSAQDFVRRLARSLVFDQQRVDDVVQEAWVAAMQRPPRERAAVAGWFRATLHNLARRRARDEARRRTRELAAARPEALPSTADVLAREGQRREVVDAVLALPEPYRGIVRRASSTSSSPRRSRVGARCRRRRCGRSCTAGSRCCGSSSTNATATGRRGACGCCRWRGRRGPPAWGWPLLQERC